MITKTFDGKPHFILATALEALFCNSGFKPSEIMKAVSHLSELYISGMPPSIDTRLDAVGYALYFMPEHFLKPFLVVTELRNRGIIRSKGRLTISDIGSGPGTAVWAIAEALPECELICNIHDRSSSLLDIASAVGSFYSGTVKLTTRKAVFPGASFPSGKNDLIVFCNTLSEQRSSAVEQVTSAMDRLEDAGFILVIEPASDQGMELLTEIMKKFRMHIAAPCPQTPTCPKLKKTSSICQMDFSCGDTSELYRVVNAGHRRLKFGWLLISKAPSFPGNVAFRLLGRFEKQPWGYEAPACDGVEFRNLTFKKRDIESRKALELMECGDLVQPGNFVQKKNRMILENIPVSIR